MTVLDLLTHLRALDVNLRVDGEQLHFDAPPGALTPELRETLRSRKRELVDYLCDLRGRQATAGSIGRATRSGPPRVSFAQRRMWFLQQLTPDSLLYNLPGALRLTGALDVHALRQSLVEIQQRHEVLRTTFALEDDEPIQQISDHVDVALAVTDLTSLSDEEAQIRLTALTSAWSREPFDLSTGPLFRAHLVQLGEREHVLLLAFHHIVCDGWSIGVFVRELTTLYGAFVQGLPSPLPALPLQYADFAEWQRDWLQGPVLESQLAYWRRQLALPLPVLELPTDRPRPALQTFNGALHWFTVPAETVAGMEALARERGATLFMALLAAFKVLLFRYSGQTDVVVGSPIANRSRPELESLLGFFVNSIALRTKLAHDQSFHQVLDQVREVCLGAFEHQDVPLETLVEEIRPDRDARRSPVYQVMFALQTAPGAPLELPELTVASIELEAVTAKFDLTLSLKQTRDSLTGVFEYNTDLFDRSTIESMTSAFCKLLKSVAEDPLAPVGAIALLGAGERAALVAGGTGAASAYPREATLAALVGAQVTARPDVVAVEDGATRWTYGELGRRAAQLAGVLRAAGVGPNVAVGVWLERGAPLVMTLVGIAVAGGAYVPLEVTQPASRAARLWQAAGTTVVITTAALAGTVPSGPWRVVTLETVAKAPAAAVTPQGMATDLAYVMYTSGSTGAPKGVAVPQRAVVRLVCGTDYVQLGPATVLAQVATAAFDAATFEIWGALLNGGRVVVVPTAVAVAPGALGAYLQRTGVTTLFLTTALVQQVGREAPGALAGLDTVLFGGEAVEPRWLAAIQAAGGPRRLLHVYGPTETTTFATWHPVGRLTADAPTIPIGGPIAQTQIYVLDAVGALVPVGMAGELYVGGDGLAREYVGAARLTAMRFVPDGVSGAAGARLYRTGDLVRWQGPGVLTFLGRRDGQVKLRGYRIELGEVEAALAGLPEVGAAVVVLQGAGEAKRLVGYVVPRAGSALEAGALRAALKALLPGYMVPAALVVLPALPLNTNGKVDRRALPAPEAEQLGFAAGSVPRSSVEAQIAAVWAQALGVSTVGVTDNFFDVGGHSLLLVRVQAGLEAALGRRVPLVTLFQYPTVEALAAHLTGAAVGAAAGGPARETVGGGIAVIGLAGRFPGAADVATFWANLRAGVESIRQFSAAELTAAGVPAALAGDPRYVPARGVLEDVGGFDAGLFGYTPREAALLDPQQRLLLECAWTALEQAGYAPGTRQVARIGVYAGTSANTYLGAAGPGALAGVGPLQVLLASDKDFLATRVSYKLQLTGPSLTVQTACSTSLVAVHAACQALRAGECDVALAGGVSVTVPDGGYLYHPDGIASPDGHCRAFDAEAAGTVAGNGVAMVVLKPLAAAQAAGDPVYAVIRGTAINNDGADKVGFTAPSVSGQAAVIAAAQAAAGVEAASIGYIEAHGTGTALGDPIEVAALRAVFGDGAGPGTCGLGSVKSNVGHLDAAAGVTGLIKTVLALQHQEIPPSLHFTRANPQLDLGPFYVPTAVTPWVAAAGTPRRAGVSAFGMGGTNAHVIVEEAPAAPAAVTELADGGRAWHVVPVSGQSEAAVTAAAAQLATYLETHAEVALADVAYTQQVGRAPLRQRRAAVGRDAATVAAQLRTGATAAAGTGPMVWVFPGQGPHAVGMGRALYEQEPVFRAELTACAEVVQTALGADLITVLYPPPGGEAAAAAQLAEPAWTQVGLVAVELGLAALWRGWGVTPHAVIGHSVGELAAACVAGVLSREASLQLAATRGTLMAAAPAGGLLAVAAAAAAVKPYLGTDLWVAAVNSPTQCVVAGTAAALQAGAARLAAAGLVTQPLAATGAFHSGLLAEVVAPLTAAAAAVPRAAPQLPWISTVTGTALAAAEATDPGYWGRQVTAPVQWAAAVATARATLGAAPLWLEVGPGPTLTRLTRAGAAPEERAIASLLGPDAAQSVATALAQLWTAGVALDWAAAHAGARRRLPLPTYPFQHHRYWLDPAPQRAPLDVFSATAKKPDVGSWFHRALWKQAAPLSTRPAESKQPRRWLIFADDATLVDQLKARLSGGDETIVVEAGEEFSAGDGQRYTIRPDVPRDYDTLLQSIDATGGIPTDIVHVWGVTLESEKDSTDVAIDDRCFYSLLYLAQALSRESMAAPVRLTVVTNHVHAVTGQEDLCPSKAVVMGPCRTIPAEFRHVSCTQVDIVWPDGGRRVHSAIDLLAAELLADNRPSVVAHRGAHRWVQAFEPVAAPSSTTGATRLRPRGTYLVTGGLGGVGLALAETLAELAQARLVLVGRTALPPREEWSSYMRDHRNDRVSERIERLLALESMGADVLVISADVASTAQMDAALRLAHARFGAIHGVIHAAGIGGDGLIALKTREDATGVLTPKVTGTHVLERLIDSEPLDFLVLCSSLTAFLGGLGQVDYCAANAFLDAYAQARWCQGDERVVSINWDTWGDVGMAVDTPVPSQLARRKEQVLESGMTASEGKDVFLRALAVRAPQVTVCTKELGALIAMMAAAALPRPELADEDLSPRPRHPRPALTTAHVAPSRELERVVCAAFERALGLEGIGIHDNFFELGGHSVLAVDMMSELNGRLHASVPVAALYEGLTPGSLASLFEDDREGRSDARETVGAGRRRHKSRRPTGATRRRDSRIERRQRP